MVIIMIMVMIILIITIEKPSLTLTALTAAFLSARTRTPFINLERWR